MEVLSDDKKSFNRLKDLDSNKNILMVYFYCIKKGIVIGVIVTILKMKIKKKKRRSYIFIFFFFFFFFFFLHI